MAGRVRAGPDLVPERSLDRRDPGAGPIDPQLLARAARPGRTRGVALDLWSRATADRERAGPALSRGLREARALHSAERRLVQDQLYAWIRRERGLVDLLGPEPLRGWLGNLVLAGLDPALAAAQVGAVDWAALPARLASLGDGLPPPERLALRHSLPDPLARRLVDQLGAEEAEAFLRASDERAPVTIRANLRRGSIDRLVDGLRAEGVLVTPLALPGALRVEGRANLEATRAFRDGWFEVQDQGSQRLAALVGPSPGAVLDLCAGAGGKALALADRGWEVLAADVRPRALEELSRRARRAGVGVRTVVLPEGRIPDGLAARRFDAVLVDAPCSGTGVLRRHPETRWRWSEERVAALVATEGELLERAAALVRPGGRLVYATCSVDRAEDEDVVDAFLVAHPGWRPGDELRTWPHRDGADGFFARVLLPPGPDHTGA